MTTIDGPAMMAAIIAQPEEDTPRLAYADWLQENGDEPRAEFIRVQVELAKIGHLHPPADEEDRAIIARHAELVRREAELFYDTWIRIGWYPVGWNCHRHLDDPGRYPGRTVVMRRGFVETVVCPAADFMEHAARMFRTHPITHVVLPGAVRGGVLFRNSSGGGGVSDDLNPDQWERLGIVGCSHWTGDCRGRGTHAHMSEDDLSAILVRYGRRVAGVN